MIFVDIVLPVFLLVGLGAVYSRHSKTLLEPLTGFSLYLATPALVFCSLAEIPAKGSEVGALLAVMGAYTFILWLLAALASRWLGLGGNLSNAFALATVPMNVGNYGLPLVRFAFGPGAVPYSVLVFVVFNIPLATWAIWVAAGGGSRGAAAARDALKIPVLHAALLALLLNWLGVRVPAPLMKALSLLGEASIPLMMVILGIQLERTRLLASPATLAAASALRLAVAPVLAWLLTGLAGLGEAERRILVLQTSTPSAVLPLLYVLRFKGDASWLASNLLFSTLLSAVTVTLLLNLLLP